DPVVIAGAIAVERIVATHADKKVLAASIAVERIGELGAPDALDIAESISIVVWVGHRARVGAGVVDRDAARVVEGIGVRPINVGVGEDVEAACTLDAVHAAPG